MITILWHLKNMTQLLWSNPAVCSVESIRSLWVYISPSLSGWCKSKKTGRLAAWPKRGVSICVWLTAGSVQRTVSPQHPFTEGQEEALALLIPLTYTGSFLELHSRMLSLFHLMGWKAPIWTCFTCQLADFHRSHEVNERTGSGFCCMWGAAASSLWSQWALIPGGIKTELLPWTASTHQHLWANVGLNSELHPLMGVAKTRAYCCGEMFPCGFFSRTKAFRFSQAWSEDIRPGKGLRWKSFQFFDPKILFILLISWVYNNLHEYLHNVSKK